MNALIVYLVFIIFHLIDQVKSAKQLNETCQNNISETLKYAQKKYIYNLNVNYLYFSGFDNYNSILLSCGAYYDVNEIDEVFLQPKKPIMLDDSLKLEKMFKNEYLTVGLLNVKGIALYERKNSLNLLRQTTVCCIEFLHTTLDIYLNSSKMSSKLDCRKDVVKNMTNFMAQPYEGLSFRNVIFPSEGFCPMIFEKSAAKTLHFGVICNSLLIKNRLSFIQVNKSSLPYLEDLEFEMSYEILTSEILDIQLFNKLDFLILTRNLLGIEASLLENFRRLKYIDIILINLGEFFHAGTQWLSHTFKNEVFNLSDTKVIKKNSKIVRFIQSEMETSFTQTYPFPNEDICLFKDFPHTNLALPIIIFDQPASCTCTLKWLQMYYNAYESILTITNDYEMFYNDSRNYIRYIKYIYRFCAHNQNGDCDFVDIFNRCNITHKQSNKNMNDQDVYFIVKWLQ